ncbi:zinc finger and BTB domain-containing protein 39-like [Takifugu rubripes]|uniref:zinc finger and BTB domain-containing protein 39-like n=1 Tax=Takifugu rubripes TaxID=31033 RepID=UPI00114520EE|nr:zinc finger and BTB domain-containing protein 39-like [Takifugu rubripes]
MRIQLRGFGHAVNLLAELNRCRQARQFCDVFLRVGNRTFAAHRVVLACTGTYFLSLFARTVAPPTATLSLEFISPANFEKVLTFIYMGEILTDLIDVGVLYEMAERLGVAELVRACHATFLLKGKLEKVSAERKVWASLHRVLSPATQFLIKREKTRRDRIILISYPSNFRVATAHDTY